MFTKVSSIFERFDQGAGHGLGFKFRKHDAVLLVDCGKMHQVSFCSLLLLYLIVYLLFRFQAKKPAYVLDVSQILNLDSCKIEQVSNTHQWRGISSIALTNDAGEILEADLLSLGFFDVIVIVTAYLLLNL